MKAMREAIEKAMRDALEKAMREAMESAVLSGAGQTARTPRRKKAEWRQWTRHCS